MFRVRVKTRVGKPAGVAGRIGLSFFFLIFGGMGLIFTGLIVKTVWGEWQSRGWPETPCRVVESSVARETKGDGDYQFQVRYEYRWEGRLHESTRWRRSGGGFRDYGEAQALVERYPAGRDAVCRVNPAAPAEAILETGSLAIGAIIFLPLIFVAIGLGGLWFTWRAPRESPAVSAPLSASAKPPALARWLPAGFCAVFLVVGLVVSFFLFVRPVFKVLAARSWPAVPCVVESSRVRSHSSSDGTTYSVDILYRYEFGGREYRANRYNFMTGSSSGRDSKRAIVQRHPPGHRTVCYVNPAQPSEAALHRGFTGVMWFGLIPLAFVFFGAAGLRYTLRAAREPSGLRTPATTTNLRPSAADQPATEDSRELKPAASPLVQVVAAALVTLFWNGIVSVFVVEVIQSFARGRPEWFLMIFLIPFVLIGLVIFGIFIYSLLAVFNPRPHFTVAPGAGRLGGDLRVAWRFTGAAHRLERLRVTLEGRESATYRRGTDTTTDTAVFARVPVADTAERTAMHSGNATVRLPLEAAAPSFQAKNNKVEWSLIVRGTIGRWPDVVVEFPYEMRPAVAAHDASAPAPAVEAEPERSASGNARIGVRGGRRLFRPGEVIEGAAGWSREKPPILAEARLIWFTRGKGTPDVTVVESITFPTRDRESVQPFRFTLPDGPLSFAGPLIAVNWAVELVLEPGAESARWEFQLATGASPAQLNALPDERFEYMKQWYDRFRRKR